MKTSILILLLALSSSVCAQDIFQKHLYSPELIMKYREEAGISADQVEKIKSIYNTGQVTYNNKQWDLSAAMTKLEQLIAQSSIDSKAADIQLEKVLELEADLKKMKLATLSTIKNNLTPAQQAKLDTHKGEFMNESFITAPLNDTQSAQVKIHGMGGRGWLRNQLGSKPLYVIVEGDEKKETYLDVINLLNPADVDAVEILRGSAATTAYGEKGKDGVIILTLKKKKKD